MLIFIVNQVWYDQHIVFMIKNLLQKANFVFALTEQDICGFPILMTYLFCHIYIVHVHRFSYRER